jgi:L-fuconate dehydratase
MFDFLAVSGSWDGRMIEYVDHLHEHFVEPARVERGRYMPPRAPGAGAQMHPESVADYLYPTGPRWRDRTPQLAEATNVEGK